MLESSQREYEMQLPKYLKCLVKVKNNPFTLMNSISLHFIYSLSSCLCLFFSSHFFCKDKVEVVIEMSGSICVLKKPEGGENTHSVLEVFSVPMCISRPNQEKWSERRVIPFLMSVLD